MAKAGRPPKYTRELADEICERLAGGESLQAICSDDHMPTVSTIFRWLHAGHEGFREAYARAREFWADAEFERIMEIADTPQIGEKIKIDGDGKTEITQGDMIEHRRLQVDARKWALARMSRWKYGDRVAQEISGPGGAPIQHQISVRLVDAVAPAALEAGRVVDVEAAEGEE